MPPSLAAAPRAPNAFGTSLPLMYVNQNNRYNSSGVSPNSSLYSSGSSSWQSPQVYSPSGISGVGAAPYSLATQPSYQPDQYYQGPTGYAPSGYVAPVQPQAPYQDGTSSGQPPYESHDQHHDDIYNPWQMINTVSITISLPILLCLCKTAVDLVMSYVEVLLPSMPSAQIPPFDIEQHGQEATQSTFLPRLISAT